MGRTAGPWALAISLLAHGAVMATAGLVGAAMHEADADRSERRAMAPSPRGDTFDIEGLVDAPSGRSTPSPDIQENINDDAGKPAPAEPLAPPPAPAKPTPVVPPEPQPKQAPQPEQAPQPKQALQPEREPQPGREPQREPERAAPPPHAAPSPPPGPPAPSKSEAGKKPESPEASSSASPGSHDSSSDGPGPGRRHGAEHGPRHGFARVGPAFARAIARAVNTDPIWSELPLGRVGAFELDIAIDADGKIADVMGDEKLGGPLAALVRRTRPALFGRFTLTDGGHEGVDTLRITVHLEQRPPPPDEKLRFGATPPDEGPPWKAYFTLESGRHFEALVEVVASKARP